MTAIHAKQALLPYGWRGGMRVSTGTDGHPCDGPAEMTALAA